MFVFDPGALVMLGVAEVLYVRAVRVLRRRGHRVPVLQQLSWHAAMAVEAVALLGPLDALADKLVLAHMAQHLALADVAVPFLLVGLRTPVLVFMPPRLVLIRLARLHRLRRVVAFLTKPLVAVPVYLLILYGWHLAPAFEGALRHPALHAVQHLSFVVGALIVWWPALEPQRRQARGELWKIPYIFGARMGSMLFGSALIFVRTPIYSSFYGGSARSHGLTPLEDQQLAGGLMMTLDIVIMLAGLIYFFWRASQDADVEERRERAAAVSAGSVAT
jgi:putative membrane protein